MHRYERLSLRDCATLITIGRSPAVLGFRYHETGIPFICAEAITGLGTIDAEGLKFIDEQMHARASRSSVRIGDVLMTTSKTKHVKSTVVSASGVPANVNENVAVIRLRPQLLSPYYLHYYIAAAALMADGGCILSHFFHQNRTVAQLGLCEIPLPLISVQAEMVADLITCDTSIMGSLTDIQASEAILRTAMDGLFSTDGLNSASQDDPAARISLDQIMEPVANKTIETALHPGQILFWQDRHLLPIAEIDPAQMRKVGLLAKPGDAVMISAMPQRYYLAKTLVDCIAPHASLVLRAIKPDNEFLCLHTLLSPAFVQHASRIAMETKTSRPQWKFIRKYKIQPPSNAVLEQANTALRPIYKQWHKSIKHHVELKKRRANLLTRFWHDLHLD